MLHLALNGAGLSKLPNFPLSVPATLSTLFTPHIAPIVPSYGTTNSAGWQATKRSGWKGSSSLEKFLLSYLCAKL